MVEMDGGSGLPVFDTVGPQSKQLASPSTVVLACIDDALRKFPILRRLDDSGLIVQTGRKGNCSSPILYKKQARFGQNGRSAFRSSSAGASVQAAISVAPSYRARCWVGFGLPFDQSNFSVAFWYRLIHLSSDHCRTCICYVNNHIISQNPSKCGGTLAL